MRQGNLGGGDPPDRLVMRCGLVLLLIHLHCGRVACFHDSIFNYVSFEETGEWNTVYSQTCKGNSHDAYREPRLVQFPENMRPPWESKTPVSINSKEAVRKDNDNLTLYVFSNPGIRGGYSVSYGFQRNKECLHGHDDDCVAHRTLGNVRALVLNGERFKEGESLNYIKDHFLIEDPEHLVTIINAGSPYERKFYEAVFLGGYAPTALQNRGRSSHVIDGKSYPMEIYMYFLDEAIPSMSLATILVVLVEESKRDNPYIKPIVSTVNNTLYDEERRYIHNSGDFFRKQRIFHNQEPSLKYNIFANQKKKTKEEIRMERFKSSGGIEEDEIGLMEVYERMEALEYQLFIIDEDLEKADKTLGEVVDRLEMFEARENKTKDFPYDHDELYFIVRLGQDLGAYNSRNTTYQDFVGKDYFGYNKPADQVLTLSEWNGNRAENKTGVFDVKLGILETKYGKIDPSTNKTELNLLYKQFNKSALADKEKKSKNALDQLRSLSFNFTVHCQKHMNWLTSNRNHTKMKNISHAEKYRHIKKFQELEKQKAILNEQVYNYFFGKDSLHQEALKWNFTDVVPDFQNAVPVEEKKHKVMDSVLLILELSLRRYDYEEFIKKTKGLLDELWKAQKFPDEKTMRDVLHYHNFGYKELDLKNRRILIHELFYSRHLPYQEKRRGFVETGNMEMSKEDNKAEIKTSPLKVKVEEAFQVSWLLPPNGGYYYYSGSSPVPPCYRAQNVIVFKKPIKMSRPQIEVLTRVPISFDRKWDIVHTTPVLHETKFRVKLQNGPTGQMRYEEIVVPVYNQPRNHLFLGHDGVHNNSVEKYEKRKNGTGSDSSNNKPTGRFRIIWSFILGLFLTHVLN